MKINHIMKNKLLYCDIWFVFQTNCKISNSVTFKDKILSFLCSTIVYKFQSGGCNATYYGKTKPHFKSKMCDDSGIKEHLLFCNHAPYFEDFSILTTNNNNFKVMLMESLQINGNHPPLDENKLSLPLECFDS